MSDPGIGEYFLVMEQKEMIGGMGEETITLYSTMHFGEAKKMAEARAAERPGTTWVVLQLCARCKAPRPDVVWEGGQ